MRSVTFFFARRILYRGSPKRNLSLDEFFQRMSIREDVPLATAREHAHVVMSVLADALSRGEFEDIRARYRSNSTMNSLKGSKGSIALLPGRSLLGECAKGASGNFLEREENTHAKETSTATGQRDTWSQ